jgi:hypothetical protein
MAADSLVLPRRIAAELFERSSRIKNYLDRIGPGELGEYAQLSETIRSALRGIEDLVATSFETVRQLPRPPPTALDAVYASLERFSHWFTRAHELLTYLPRQHVAPETFAVLQHSFGAHYAERKPSIILGSLFNAFEFDFVQELESRIPDLRDVMLERPKNIVLELAICDQVSPFAWSVLAHELGHAIDEDAGISQIAMEAFSRADEGSRDLLAQWSGELAADIIATRALGPAPMLALISMSYCLLPLQSADSLPKSHPPFRWRLQVLREFMSEFVAGFAPEFDTYVGAAREMSRYRGGGAPETDPAQPPGMFDGLVRPLAKSIADEVINLKLDPFSTTSESLKRCQRRLRDRLPIGAQGLPRDVLRREVARFKARRYRTGEQREAAFMDLLPQFAESPLNVGTVLAAAFLRRANIMSEFCNSADTLTVEAVEAHCRSLHQLDALVSSSVRSSSIHRQLPSRSESDAPSPAQGSPS